MNWIFKVQGSILPHLFITVSYLSESIGHGLSVFREDIPYLLFKELHNLIVK